MHELSFSHRMPFSEYEGGIGIEVRLIGDSPISLVAKLDTGASSCVFQYPYGKHIGLNVEAGDRQRISTVTGVFEAYLHWVNFQVLDLEFYGPVLFYPQHMSGRNVLGLHGFLNQFSQFGIRYNHNEIFMAAGSDHQTW